MNTEVSLEELKSQMPFNIGKPNDGFAQYFFRKIIP